MKTIEALQKAVDFIEDNLCEELSPETIAAQAYLSSAHFQRMFSAVCELPLGEYIRGRRLTMAGKEILETDRKIIEIAFQYGYESPESFSRAFVRFHGQSPFGGAQPEGRASSVGKSQCPIYFRRKRHGTELEGTGIHRKGKRAGLLHPRYG